MNFEENRLAVDVVAAVSAVLQVPPIVYDGGSVQWDTYEVIVEYDSEENVLRMSSLEAQSYTTMMTLFGIASTHELDVETIEVEEEDEDNTVSISDMFKKNQH